MQSQEAGSVWYSCFFHRYSGAIFNPVTANYSSHLTTLHTTRDNKQSNEMCKMEHITRSLIDKITVLINALTWRTAISINPFAFAECNLKVIYIISNTNRLISIARNLAI